MQTKQRYLYLDILRFLSIFGVVAIHVTSQYITQSFQASDGVWWFAHTLQVLSRSSVVLFIMISGALNLFDYNTESVGFYKKRMVKVFLPLVLWSFIYILWESFYFDVQFDLNTILQDLFNGRNYYHLYFLFIILGLYLVTPYLKKLFQTISGKEVIYITLFLLLISILWKFVESMIFQRYEMNTLNIFIMFFPYLSIYILGHILTKYINFRITKRHLVLSCIVLISFVVLLSYLFFEIFGFGVRGFYLYTYLNPFTISISVIIFILFRRIRFDSFVTQRWREIIIFLSNATFFIYLCHPIFIDIINRKYPSYGLFSSNYLRTITTIILSLILSLVSYFILKKIKLISRII